MIDNYQNAVDRIKESFYKVFPNGYINIWTETLVGRNRIFIELAMIGKQSDQTNNQYINDPMYHKLVGHLKAADKIELETLLGGVKCQSRHIINTRKRTKTDTMYNHIKALNRWFNNLGDTIIENRDSLYKRNIKPIYYEITT